MKSRRTSNLQPPTRVASVLDEWRIDDEWWRERPISRLYYSLLLEGGGVVTVHRDLVSGAWFEQRDQDQAGELSGKWMADG